VLQNQIYFDLCARIMIRGTSTNAALGIAYLALRVGQTVPDGCELLLEQSGVAVPKECVTYYVTPGGPLFTGKPGCDQFISFLFENMDNPDRVEWKKLTGQEQYEWYMAWTGADCSHMRHEPATRGLRGTNLARITDAANLEEAMIRSPSLADRDRPQNHVVPDADWANTRRNLFG